MKGNVIKLCSGDKKNPEIVINNMYWKFQILPRELCVFTFETMSNEIGFSTIRSFCQTLIILLTVSYFDPSIRSAKILLVSHNLVCIESDRAISNPLNHRKKYSRIRETFSCLIIKFVILNCKIYRSLKMRFFFT